MVALAFPIPLHGIPAFKRLARIMLPIVSYFPMFLIFYGNDGADGSQIRQILRRLRPDR